MTFPCTVFSKWRMDFRPLSFFSSSPTPEASMDPFSPASRSFQIFCAPPILSFILLFVPPSLRFAISLIFVFIGSFSPVVFHCSSNIMARVAAPMFTLHMTPPFALSPNEGTKFPLDITLYYFYAASWLLALTCTFPDIPHLAFAVDIFHRATACKADSIS